jgi:hypothetical protein
MPLKQKTEKIDALLKKAGLATPAPVADDDKQEAVEPGAK